MQIVLLSVGDPRKSPEADLVADYVRRAGRFSPVETRAVKEEKGGQAPDPRISEGKRLLASLRSQDLLIACDERGTPYTTEGFARFLERATAEAGSGRLVFAVGGSEGLSDEVLDRARYRLALSRMTLPHELARVLLAEQVYRALSLTAGHPYHRGGR